MIGRLLRWLFALKPDTSNWCVYCAEGVHGVPLLVSAVRCEHDCHVKVDA